MGPNEPRLGDVRLDARPRVGQTVLLSAPGPAAFFSATTLQPGASRYMRTCSNGLTALP